MPPRRKAESDDATTPPRVAKAKTKAAAPGAKSRGSVAAPKKSAPVPRNGVVFDDDDAAALRAVSASSFSMSSVSMTFQIESRAPPRRSDVLRTETLRWHVLEDPRKEEVTESWSVRDVRAPYVDASSLRVCFPTHEPGRFATTTVVRDPPGFSFLDVAQVIRRLAEYAVIAHDVSTMSHADPWTIGLGLAQLCVQRTALCRDPQDGGLAIFVELEPNTATPRKRVAPTDSRTRR